VVNRGNSTVYTAGTRAACPGNAGPAVIVIVIDYNRAAKVKATTPESIIVRITVITVIGIRAVPVRSGMVPSPVIVVERIVIERMVAAVIPAVIAGIGIETRTETAVGVESYISGAGCTVVTKLNTSILKRILISLFIGIIFSGVLIGIGFAGIG
jgi:hypothetical protein